MRCLPLAICAASTLVFPIAQQAPPVFRGGVTHVLVDVVVTDRADRPVADLTQDDFEIRQDDRLQHIADFERVLVPVGDRAVDLTAAPAPAPDVASNSKPPHAARAFVFMLDDLALGTKDIVVITRVMTEFLKSLSPDDQVAITYVSRSDLGQDFTQDVGLLGRAVRNLKTALPGAGGPRTLPISLKNVIESLAGAQETRRALIFVSNGHKFDLKDDASQELLEILNLARRSDIPIYTIDPRGLMAPELGFEGHLEDQTPEMRAALDQAIFDQQQGNRTWAENTGGLAFVSNSNLTKAVHDLVTDNGAYYLLGFYPAPYVADGQFHPIDVRVRREGLRVRAREGYTAAKEGASVAPLLDTLGEGLPGGDLELRAFAAPLTPTSHGVMTLLTLEVDYPQLVGVTARSDDQLQVDWIAIDSDAHVRATGKHRVSVPLAGRGVQALTLALNDALELPNGRLTLRVAVESQRLGTRGSVHLPIDVPRLSGRTVVLAPLVLGGDARQATLVADLASNRATPFQPTTRRTFARNERLVAFGRVFSGSSSEVHAEFRLVRDDKMVATVPARAQADQPPLGAVDYVGVVELGDLPPGSYVLQIQASQSTQSATRGVVFEIK